MTAIGNGPESVVVLRLQARKSFALGLWITDHNDHPLDISGAAIRMVVRKQRIPSSVANDNGNLIGDSTAMIIAPSLGYARIDIQAIDLDFKPGTYDFSIVLTDQGYSSVIVAGELDLEQNTEFSSIDSTYVPTDQVSTALQVALRGNNTLTVKTGPTLAPGAVTFTAAMEQKLLEIYGGMLVNGELITADDIADGVGRVIMTVAERAKLSGLTNFDPATLGTAAAKNIEFFRAASANIPVADLNGVIANSKLPKITGLLGFSKGTAAPSGGASGDIYFQLTT